MGVGVGAGTGVEFGVGSAETAADGLGWASADGVWPAAQPTASKRIRRVRGIRALIRSNSSVYFPEIIVSIAAKSFAV